MTTQTRYPFATLCRTGCAVALLGAAALVSGCHAQPQSHGASQASFDCAKASTKMEKTICATPELGKADVAMAAQYKADLARLTPEGRAALTLSQRGFLRYANELCVEGAHAGEESQWANASTTVGDKRVKLDPAAACLIDQFQSRTSMLQSAIVSLGGRTFVTTDSYRLTYYAGSGINIPELNDAGYVTQNLQTVQIDGAAIPAERTWNAGMAQWRDDLRDAADISPEDGQPMHSTDTDVDVHLTVTSASDDLIIAEAAVATSNRSGAHPFNTERRSNWSLKLGRDLKTTDLFDAGKPWQTALLPLAQANLKSVTGQPKETLDKVEHIDDIDHWQLAADGLHIAFGQYELGSYLSSAETVLPWADLKPYLRTDLPFDPVTLRSPSAPAR